MLPWEHKAFRCIPLGIRCGICALKFPHTRLTNLAFFVNGAFSWWNRKAMPVSTCLSMSWPCQSVQSDNVTADYILHRNVQHYLAHVQKHQHFLPHFMESPHKYAGLKNNTCVTVCQSIILVMALRFSGYLKTSSVMKEHGVGYNDSTESLWKASLISFRHCYSK